LFPYFGEGGSTPGWLRRKQSVCQNFSSLFLPDLPGEGSNLTIERALSHVPQRAHLLSSSTLSVAMVNTHRNSTMTDAAMIVVMTTNIYGLETPKPLLLPRKNLHIHLIPQILDMNVNGRMNLLFVKRVILGSANLVGDVGSKLP
jgi:hypothetical protein